MTSSQTSGQGGGGVCGRRRRSVDNASVTAETAAATEDEKGSAATTDDMGLEPRIRQYQKHELLQDRSPESGLSELEAFLLEKQRFMELAATSSQENVAASTCGGGGGKGSKEDDDDHDKDKLVPRAPHYVPHPILQVKTETGFTPLELYFQQKEAQLEQSADSSVDQQPAADATNTTAATSS